MGKLVVFREGLGGVFWAALGPPCGALCGQHFRKHIHWSQSGQAPQVLSGGGEEKFVAGAVWTPQAQAGKAQDALEMGEQHLDFLPTTARLLVLRRCGKRTAASRASSCKSRGILRETSFGQHCVLSSQTSQSNLLAR
jgi:hypothetical protein